MAEHVVAIKIGGRSFTGWDTVSIEMAIDQCADGFSLSSSYDPAREDLASIFRGAIYKPCVITIDDELVLTGRVEKMSAQSGADDRTINVQGRSLTASLVDCVIKDDPQLSEPINLSDVCRKVCKPFGILVRADNDCIVDPQRVEYGQKAFDFLASLAAPRHFLLNSSYDGKLVLTAASGMVNRPVVAALIEGEKPLLSVSTDNDGTKRFSLYRAATQFAGIENVIDEATDPSVTIYRPLFSEMAEVIDMPDVQTFAQAKAMVGKLRTADRIRTQAFASSFSAQATAVGWKAPDGQRWHERQMVTLHAPGAMLSREMKYVIEGVKFKLSPDSGETVDLRLMLPELHAGAMPKVLPWD